MVFAQWILSLPVELIIVMYVNRLECSLLKFSSARIVSRRVASLSPLCEATPCMEERRMMSLWGWRAEYLSMARYIHAESPNSTLSSPSFLRILRSGDISMTSSMLYLPNAIS